MPITFDRCDDEVAERMRRMIGEFHTELRDAEVTIACLFARSDEEDGIPIKAPGGWPALASIRITPLDYRVLGVTDAVIKIDEVRYERLSEASRDALIDHELLHLEIQYEGDGPGTPFKTDDHGRPKLRIRQHQFEVCGFHDIIERHGEAAIELQAAQKLAAECGADKLFGVEGATA
jgi:hypothetical protein